ncbi:MAG: GFA family protein [Sphingosinicella sp.]|nr:GFA family protein [Sphingosinicella sp.]
MGVAYKGGCSCGSVRYEIPSEPFFANHCHCDTCQGRSGTGHGSNAAFMADGLQLEGRTSTWDVPTESGDTKSHAFCGACGSPLYLTLANQPGIFIIHAASLDDPERYVPQAVTYAANALSWDKPDPALTRFEKMPPAPE